LSWVVPVHQKLWFEMKRNPWLGALENISLVSLGVGSIASILFKQILYTTTPLSLLVVLGLFNRRQFEESSTKRDLSLAEMDQKLSTNLEMLTQHISNLPNAETIHMLRQGLLMKDREVARRLYAEITSVQQELNQRLHPLEEQGLESVRQEISQMEAQHRQVAKELARMGIDFQELSDTVAANAAQPAIAQLRTCLTDLQSNVDTLSAQTKPHLASLQEQISRLDRQLSKLPPPIDLSSLKQEVGELVRMITDLVPRRDLLALVKEVRELYQQQERLKQSVEAIETAAVNHSIFGNALKPVDPDASAEAAPEIDPETNPEANQVLSGQLDQDILQQVFPPSELALNSGMIQEEAAHYLEHLRSQLATIQSFTENLAEQHQQLQEQLNHLPKNLDVAALQNQLRELSQRIPVAETTLDAFRSRIQDVIQQELQFITQQLQAVSASPSYELVFDLNHAAGSEVGGLAGSRAILEEALQSSQERLILILPWSDQCSLDQDLMLKLEAFLALGRRLDIGWCHLAERQTDRLLKKMYRGWMSDPIHQDAIQETLHHLLYLKRNYPQQFQFKILGTSENFLVADRVFAVLGISDALKTSTAFSELQLKLRTRDPDVIQRLIQHFDHPVLEADDLVAYWNRGVTRHDLGDKAGAIADYTQILRFNYDDAITYNYRGIAYYDAGQIEQAIADLTESIELNPQQAAAYCNRAFIRAEQGDPEAAIQDYTLALQNQPDWAIAYFYRGMAWQKLENHSEAISDYGEATFLASDSAVAHYYRGLAWQKLRNYQGAIADLELAAELFAARGSKTNAQKALKNLVKLRQSLAQLTHRAEASSSHPSHPKRSEKRETTAPDFETIANLFQDVSALPVLNGQGTSQGTSQGVKGTGQGAKSHAIPPSAEPSAIAFTDLFDAEAIEQVFQEN
jgi:tetratricopeptide (TPR) repeat protein